eukprot:TRINITY_DN5068_c0_g1_i3.p2 TRINITY_DN5068_c0_g1~~TRINITY_DN5068_c0_g1_i3.p2  ORF type:complete len:184 (+),score=26.75 TRINITY_DN5068_c0_g1_i3:733-1284(+)
MESVLFAHLVLLLLQMGQPAISVVPINNSSMETVSVSKDLLTIQQESVLFALNFPMVSSSTVIAQFVPEDLSTTETMDVDVLKVKFYKEVFVLVNAKLMKSLIEMEIVSLVLPIRSSLMVNVSAELDIPSMIAVLASFPALQVTSTSWEDALSVLLILSSSLKSMDAAVLMDSTKIPLEFVPE